MSYSSHFNITLNQAAGIDASISARFFEGLPENYASSSPSQITARLGPIYTTGIGAIMPEGVLNLQSDPLPASIDQSDLRGNFRTILLATTGSAYAVHADSYGDVSTIPNLVLNASYNTSNIATDIDLQIRSVALSLQEAATFGVGSAISGQIMNTTTELQFSLIGLHD